MNDLISIVRQMMGQTELSQEIFIDASGRIAPCCFQAVDMPELPFVNVKDFPKLKETWTTKKCNPVCAISCGN